ncbi:MAG: hypothetical protein ABIO36_00780, partial [Pyrinomonadaceae bacterium]
MSKEMIVSVNGREKKIAILDNGKVTEFYIERGEENTGVAGNVYKGRVMRVLPGMQSAFVDIGLERDAFLYVSDFFDEDEEIERIVMEKSKKGSPEDAKREANDQIDRSRIQREKQMDVAQEIVEPLSEIEPGDDDEDLSSDEPEVQIEARPERPARGRGRGKREKEQVNRNEADVTPIFEIEFDNSGFERISDGDDAGEPFSDSYVPELAIDRVRAAEFEMEGIAGAAVGSLMAEVGGETGGFERIADEDEETPAPTKGRKAKSATDTDEKAPPKRKAPAKRAAAKGKFSKPKAKKAAKGDSLEDAEASHKESDDNAEMAVRRGGRGRRRGGKLKSEDGGEEGVEDQEMTDAPFEVVDETPDTVEEVMETPQDESETNPEAEPAEDRERPTDDRSRGRDNRNTRGKRGSREQNDRPNAERPTDEGPNDDRLREE